MRLVASAATERGEAMGHLPQLQKEECFLVVQGDYNFNAATACAAALTTAFGNKPR
jgi:hypothetical protein